MGNRVSRGETSPAVRIWVCVVVCVFVRLFSARFAESYTAYELLRRPSWAPSGWLLSAIDVASCVPLGLALALLLDIGWSRVGVRRALVLFTVQFVLAMVWLAILFRIPSTGPALIVALVLWLTLAWTTAAFWSVRDTAGALLLPSWAWATFIVAVCAAIWRLN